MRAESTAQSSPVVTEAESQKINYWHNGQTRGRRARLRTSVGKPQSIPDLISRGPSLQFLPLQLRMTQGGETHGFFVIVLLPL